MLIAEDLLLLLLDDASGKVHHSTYLEAGIGGALLVELALGAHVEVSKGSGLWARAKVYPTGAVLPADPMLAEALGLVAARERTAQDLVGRLGKKRREPLLGRLEANGIVRRQEDTLLGLFPRRRWPALDSSHEADVRRKLGDALVGRIAPDERTSAIVALLSALDIPHKVIDVGLPAREVKARAKQIADGDWAAKAVRDAVAAAQAAVVAATVAATSVAATSS